MMGLSQTITGLGAGGFKSRARSGRTVEEPKETLESKCQNGLRLKIISEVPSKVDFDFSGFQSYATTQAKVTKAFDDTRDPGPDQFFWMKIDDVYFNFQFIQYKPKWSVQALLIKEMYLSKEINKIDWTKIMNTLIIVLRRATSLVYIDATYSCRSLFVLFF